MAVGFLLALLIFAILPAILLVTVRNKLPFGGEKELLPLTLLLSAVVAVLVVSPNSFVALDITELGHLEELRVVKEHSVAGHPPKHHSAVILIRALPFHFTGASLEWEIAALVVALLAGTALVFALGAGAGGLAAGGAAVFFLLLHPSFRNLLRGFSEDPFEFTINLALSAVLIGMPQRWRFGPLVLAGLVLLIYGYTGFNNGNPIAPVGLQETVAPVAVLLFLGASVLAWWYRGLRVHPIDFPLLRRVKFVVVILFAAVCAQFFRYGAISGSLFLLLWAYCSVGAGAVAGSLWRFFRWHPLGVPAVMLGVIGVRLFVFPYEPRPTGGAASTVQDLKAVMPPGSSVATSMPPKLVNELLKARAISLESFIESGTDGASAQFVETRFAAPEQAQMVGSIFRLEPLLPGIYRAYNQSEAGAGSEASKE